MFYYTYFIITPGVEIGSYVTYRRVEGNYIKFGDSVNPHEDSYGIRRAYLTHNPDIGVMAVMNSQVFQAPALGTRLKNHIVGLGYEPVGTTSEWFSIERNAAWSLARAMLSWDEVVLDLDDQAELEEDITEALTDRMIMVPERRVRLARSGTP